MAKKNNKNKKKPPSAHDLFSMPHGPSFVQQSKSVAWELIIEAFSAHRKCCTVLVLCVSFILINFMVAWKIW